MRVVALLALVGCARFDPARSIELVPASSWSESEVARIEAAAECWNLGFGMDFSVTKNPSSDQVAFVEYNDFACLGAFGIFTPGQPAGIDICPTEHARPIPTSPGFEGVRPPLFMVVVHELGHAAGIRTEGSDQFAVMGGNNQAYYAERFGVLEHAFAPEDHELIHDADPHFVEAPACAPEDLFVIGDGDSGARCMCR